MPVIDVKISKRVMVGNVECDDCHRYFVQSRLVDDFNWECPYCCLKKAVAAAK